MSTNRLQRATPLQQQQTLPTRRQQSRTGVFTHRSAIPGRAGLWSPVMGQPASRPRSATVAHPLLGLAAHVRRGDDEQLVAAPEHGLAAGTNPLPSRTTSVTLAPAAAAARTPRRRAAGSRGPTCTWSTSAPSSSSGVDSTSRSTGADASASPSRRATHGRVGAWTRVKMTTRTKTRSKSQRRPARPASRARSPARPGRRRAARPRTGTPGRASGIRNGVSETSTDSGRATQQQHQPDDRAAGHELVAQLGRRGQQAEQDEQPDLGQPAQRRRRSRGRPPGAAAGCCPAPAPARYAAMKPDGVHGGGHGVREDGQARRPRCENRPDEAAATRRSSRRPAQPTASPIAAPPTSSTPASSSSVPPRVRAPAPAPPGRRARRRGCTTGASLNPDSASSIPVSRRGSGTRRSTENTAAASVEVRIAPTSSATVQRRWST